MQLQQNYVKERSWKLLNNSYKFNLIPIGKVTRPHGVKGEVRIYRYNPNSTLLFEIDHIWIRKEDTFIKYKIQSSRLHQKLVLVKLDKINDRTEAELLRDHEVYVKKSQLPPLKDDEFYIIEIMNSKVYNLEGKYFGILKEIYDTPLYTVGVVSKKNYEIDIPLIPEYIAEFIKEENKLIIRNLEEFPIVKRRKRKRL